LKIELIGNPKEIMNNPDSKHRYFAWPTVARLQDGRIAVACSGYRIEHVCPFGKACISFSSDNGETYTKPTPIIDTVLDDRDAGVVPFGNKGVILTSFNNTVDFQREANPDDKYINAYLDTITKEEEQEAVGAEFCFSNDCANTFGKVYKSPVTSPHGPTVLSDGTILWVGRIFSDHDSYTDGDQGVQCYKVNTDGTMEKISQIETDGYYKFCEPHMVECADGRLVCHLRSDTLFTTYQTESFDKGRTWTKPHRILEDKGGAPSHIIRTSTNMLVAAYGYRELPYGIKLMFSTDNGETWDTNHILYENFNSDDIGYPATIELDDGTFLTVFYGRPGDYKHSVIMQQKWKIV